MSDVQIEEGDDSDVGYIWWCTKMSFALADKNMGEGKRIAMKKRQGGQQWLKAKDKDETDVRSE